MKKLLLLASFLLAAGWSLGLANSASRMMEDARLWLQALSSEKAGAAVYDFGNEERLNWHFIPRERKGVPFREMTPAQRKLAHNLLATGLGEEGYRKANQVMYLDQILHEMENFAPRRDADAYFFTIFGTPSATDNWGWRVEGHHLSVNFTLSGGRVISPFPLFYGANPAEVRQGPHKGLRVLAAEEDLARKLVSSFGGTQREKVVIDPTAPPDILTAAEKRVTLDTPKGVAAGSMTHEQREVLDALVRVYAGRLAPDLRDQQMQRIHKAGLEHVHFAWAGPLERGAPHYYRIQGPTFLIEYDNTQNQANHIHSVWRDPEHDFGGDPLRKHYATSDHHHPHAGAGR